MTTYFEQVSLEQVKRLTGIGKDGLPISTQNIKILLVDDSELVRRAIRGLLEDSGIEVAAEAADLSEAIRLTNELNPDVLVIDLRLKNDTFPLSDVKRKLNGSQPRVVAMSFSNDDDARVLANDLGAHTLLDKTLLAEELIPTIRTLVQRPPNPDPLTPPA
jgi:DNA-binding response OmpR family regulator